MSCEHGDKPIDGWNRIRVPKKQNCACTESWNLAEITLQVTERTTARKKKWFGTTGGPHVKNKNKIKSLPYTIYKKKI